jgi:hypothetical protein
VASLAPTEKELEDLHRSFKWIKSFVERKRDTRHRCVYCGALCRGNVCRQHRDLPQLDPGMGAVPDGEVVTRRVA